MNLLTTIKTFESKACKKFVAAERFKGEGFCLWPTFKKKFLPKTETDIPKEKLRLSRLNESSTDPAIIEALSTDHEVTLAQLFEFLKTADRAGWYIAYIKDSEGEPWAVYCVWFASFGWRVGADPLSRPRDWYAGRRVLSRDSSEPLTAEPLGSEALCTFEFQGRKYKIVEDK